jgi:mannose-6-phosphate isomerase-like protein (cupin superfamily)
MSFGTLLSGGTIPGLGFLHRGQIPPGGGIGAHFHLSSEEMFVILNEAEADFTINGRTSRVATPAGVPVQLGNFHALVNSSNTTLEWLNIAVQAEPNYPGGSIDLGNDMVGAPLDPIPTFVVMSLDKTRMGSGNAQHGANNAMQYRRALQPAVFRTRWTYTDHLIVPPGGETSGHLHTHISEFYYVINGSGTVKVNAEEAPFTMGAAIPIQAKEIHSIRNTGTEPLELLIVGIADDMTKNTETIVIP